MKSCETGREEFVRSIIAMDRYRGCSFVSYLVQRVAGLQPDEMAVILCIRWSVKTTL